MSPARLGVAAQAAYFLTSGLWAVAHRRSFEAVTGPKADYWLVRVVGGLAAAIGAALALGARREPGPETAALAAGSAATFALADAVYVARGRIRRVYLLDLAAEAAFLAWPLAARALSRSAPTPPAR